MDSNCYNKTDNKEKRISDKAFLQGLFISFVSIILAIVALSSMTYAWFTAGTVSDNNKIVSGSFDLTVKVEIVDSNNTVIEEITLSEEEGGSLKFILPLAGESYRVSLTRTEESTSKGYCYVKIGNNAQLPTDVIEAPVGGEVNADSHFNFIIIPKSNNTELFLTPHWGIHSDPGIFNNTTVSEENNTVND